MSEPAQTTTERDLKALLASGQHEAAAELAIRSYGPELLGFLRARLGELEWARDAFAWVAEDLWRGLPNFRGDSSVRTWAYAIARNAAHRYRDRELRERMQAMPISQVSRASALLVRMPTETSIEGRVARLRAQLDDDEQVLLTLRVDKNMGWNEIALIMLFNGEEPENDAVTREAARLRKRFQLLKEKLKKLVGQES